MNERDTEYLYITSIISGKKCVLEKLLVLSTRLYYTNIRMFETYVTMNQKFTNTFNVWHDRVGHLGSIMIQKIIENSCGHSLKNQKIFQSNEFSCVACSQGKLIIRPSPVKVRYETLAFLERIQGDICGLIHPSCGSFRYFMVLIDALTRWSPIDRSVGDQSCNNQGYVRPCEVESRIF